MNTQSGIEVNVFSPVPLTAVTPTGPRVMTTQTRRGALTPPHALTDAGLSPIEK